MGRQQMKDMEYTYRSIVFLWLAVAGLLAIVGFGRVSGSGILWLIPIALLAPAVILKTPASVPATSQER